MDDLLQFVPEEKQAEFSEIAKGYVKGDVDTLSSYVQSNQSLYDKLLSKPLQTREQNLREIEFPKLLETEREKLRKELNPEETPDQKRLRELEKKLLEKEQKEEQYERQQNLRMKYKDTAPDIAAKLHSLDDDSVSEVVDHIADLKKKIDELEKASKYGNKPPSGGGADSAKTITLAEFQSKTGKEQAELINNQGVVIQG